MDTARDLWWKHGIFLNAVDAMHVATALHKQCREILTRDRDIIKYTDKLAQLNLVVAPPLKTAYLPEAYRQDSFDEELEPEEGQTS